MRPRALRTRRGFTLLELLAALVLLSVWAAWVISTHFRAPEVTLEKAAILLAQDVRTAQNRSAYLGEPAVMEFDAEGYRLVDPRGRVVRHPRTQLPFVRVWSYDAVFEGVELRHADFEGAARVEFDRVGTVSTGGHVSITYRDDRRTVLVAPGSGRLQIPDSSSGWIDRTR